ncbi:MAG: hypothetical protein ACR2K0_02355 [Acidimicrobiales bacterium]
MRRPAPLLSVTVLVCTVLPLIACGPDGPLPGPGAAPGDAVPAGASARAEAYRRLAAAPEATASAGSARTTMVATISGVPGHPNGPTVAGHGQVDFAARRSHSTLDLSGLFPDGDVAAGDRSIETILDGGRHYVRSPILTSLVGVATPWMSIDPAAAPHAGPAAALGQLGQLPGGESTAPLAILAGVREGSVRTLGQEQVGGETTSHLAATVDLRAALERAGALIDPGQFEEFADRLGAAVLDVEAHLDGLGRLRRLAFEHSLPGGGAQRSELEYSDFGAPVEIAVPPDDEVTDVAEVLAR